MHSGPDPRRLHTVSDYNWSKEGNGWERTWDTEAWKFDHTNDFLGFLNSGKDGNIKIHRDAPQMMIRLYPKNLP